MNKIKSILLLLSVVMLPLGLYANESEKKSEELNIPEIVLEHLSES